MDTRKISRNDLIEYIRKNDAFYFGASFEGHSEAQLEMLKTNIELRVAKKEQPK